MHALLQHAANACCPCCAVVVGPSKFENQTLRLVHMIGWQPVVSSFCRATVFSTTPKVISEQSKRLRVPVINTAASTATGTAPPAAASRTLAGQGMSALAIGEQDCQERSPKMAKLDVITTLRVKRLTENAIIPSRGSAKAAGYDLSRLAPANMLLYAFCTMHALHRAQTTLMLAAPTNTPSQHKGGRL